MIDDDPQIRDTLKLILVDEGFAVDVAETGEEAITKAKEKWYNIALIDIRLPDITGIELLAQLRDGKPKMRKIMVTGYPTLPNAVDALNKHADAYLIKPVQIQKLLETIKAQLSLQEAERTFDEASIGEFMKRRAKAFLNLKNENSPKEI